MAPFELLKVAKLLVGRKNDECGFVNREKQDCVTLCSHCHDKFRMLHILVAVIPFLDSSTRQF